MKTRRRCRGIFTLNALLDGHTSIPRRCESPKLLFDTSRRGMIMVQIPKAYKCRLARVTESI